jgi:hypothetical protein
MVFARTYYPACGWLILIISPERKMDLVFAAV